MDYRRRADIEQFIKDNFLTQERFEHLPIQFQVWVKDTLKGEGYDKYGKIKYFSDDLLHNLTGLDFVFILNEEIWDAIQEKNRLAIIEHFLLRIEPMCEYQEDGVDKKTKCMFKELPDIANLNFTFVLTKSGRIKFKIIKPFGEFPEIISRYGDWNMDIREIKNSFKENKNEKN